MKQEFVFGPVMACPRHLGKVLENARLGLAGVIGEGDEVDVAP